MSTRDVEQLFGPQRAIGDLDLAEAVTRLRALGDSDTADELSLSTSTRTRDSFSFGDNLLGGLFNRFIRTTHVCGFLPSSGEPGRIVPVSKAPPDPTLVKTPLKITLDGLHVAKYPGRGVHSLVFDFVLQPQDSTSSSQVFHYNAKFSARDGETIPVRNFPLFYSLTPAAEGITFGFQTINVSSGVEEGLLSFLDHDDFKKGLSLVNVANPVLGQLSKMAAGLTTWLASQSRNAKVQEFRQGLDFNVKQLGGGLALGSYIVAQIPLEQQHEWNWADWTVDPSLLRLARRDDPKSLLDYNHLMFGISRME